MYYHCINYVKKMAIVILQYYNKKNWKHAALSYLPKFWWAAGGFWVKKVETCDIPWKTSNFLCSQTQLALCHYSTSMDEENFLRPGEFRPDRWIRKDASDRVDNFGSIPFGYGIRSCIGRRIAELEMHLALTQVLVCICVLKLKIQTVVVLILMFFSITAPAEVPHWGVSPDHWCACEDSWPSLSGSTHQP